MDGHVRLIVIGSLSSALADSVAQRLRRDGSVVYVTHSAEGCLRVATSVHADVVLLDPSFPPRVEKLLRAHPSSAGARILHLSEELARPSGARRPAAA
jgi:DNA-binding MurR/RpiR family transcriptional regulator